MIAGSRSLADITAQAVDVLFQELGAADAIRFFNQFSTGSGNYTEEREHLFADLTLDQLFSDVKGVTRAETPRPTST